MAEIILKNYGHIPGIYDITIGERIYIKGTWNSNLQQVRQGSNPRTMEFKHEAQVRTPTRPVTWAYIAMKIQLRQYTADRQSILLKSIAIVFAILGWKSIAILHLQYFYNSKKYWNIAILQYFFNNYFDNNLKISSKVMSGSIISKLMETAIMDINMNIFRSFRRFFPKLWQNPLSIHFFLQKVLQ